jgi:hypothetical protein
LSGGAIALYRYPIHELDWLVATSAKKLSVIRFSSDILNLTRNRSLNREIFGVGEMNAFKNQLTFAQETKLLALAAWQRALENLELRMDCPDAYHDELLRQSDEMDRLGILSWDEWRDLRRQADVAYLRAVAGDDYH